jgi:hypothetical protein
LQLAVFAYQAKKLRETVDAAGVQATEMQNSVSQATRAANAMERLADQMARTVETNTEAFATQKATFQLQLRAYVTIKGHGLVPQNRADNYKVEVRPVITNLGNTPAHSVNFSAKLEILPAELPSDHVWGLPDVAVESAAFLFPHQELSYRNWLPELISDEEISVIKHGVERRLYIYGFVRYKDIFGEDHRTDFCQFFAWDVKDNFNTVNVPGHNEYT